jgi:FHS family L-fucose permease-like MFS transporter
MNMLTEQQTETNQTNDRKYLVPFILITSLFFLWGFARAILDVLNKHFQNALHISITHSALIQVTTYLGYFLMAIPAGFFINRYGYRRGVVFGLLLFGVGALLFIPGAAVGSFSAFLLCLFIIGCGLVFLETAANPYVTELGAKETATSRLTYRSRLMDWVAFSPHFASVSSSSIIPKRAAMWWCLIPFWVFWFW